MEPGGGTPLAHKAASALDCEGSDGGTDADNRNERRWEEMGALRSGPRVVASAAPNGRAI